MSLIKQERNTVGDQSFADHTLRYPIGVAARLTGIQVETLRVWERRYGVIGPQVSATGRRLYAAEDLERLRLIKQLVDNGHPIGSVAAVPSEKLRELREVSMERFGVTSGESAETLNLRAVLVGEAQRNGRGRGLVVAGFCADIERAATQFGDTDADVVIVELPSLLDLDIEEIDAIKKTVGARLVVVLYRFGASSAVRNIRKAGHVAAHAAVDGYGLLALCRAALLPLNPAPLPAGSEQRLDHATLAQASTSIECECPKHLVELIRSLSSFETYSEQCSARSELDAALHQDLQQTAGRARVLLEQSLLRLAMLEGLPLPETRR
jgi:DNA-binding transcriptional MerR regulator